MEEGESGLSCWERCRGGVGENEILLNSISTY